MDLVCDLVSAYYIFLHVFYEINDFFLIFIIFAELCKNIAINSEIK